MLVITRYPDESIEIGDYLVLTFLGYLTDRDAKFVAHHRNVVQRFLLPAGYTREIGPDVSIQNVEGKGRMVRVGIIAPRNIPIVRTELRATGPFRKRLA